MYEVRTETDQGLEDFDCLNKSQGQPLNHFPEVFFFCIMCCIHIMQTDCNVGNSFQGDKQVYSRLIMNIPGEIRWEDVVDSGDAQEVESPTDV